jgi:hypothetical protein
MVLVLLLLMFLSPPLRGVGPMALMLGHEWQHIYMVSDAYDSVRDRYQPLFGHAGDPQLFSDEFSPVGRSMAELCIIKIQ